MFFHFDVLLYIKYIFAAECGLGSALCIMQLPIVPALYDIEEIKLDGKRLQSILVYGNGSVWQWDAVLVYEKGTEYVGISSRSFKSKR